MTQDLDTTPPLPSPLIAPEPRPGSNLPEFTVGDLARRLTNTFHDHHDLSVASMHVHLDHERCLEVSILKGRTEEVRHFADHVKAERHVTHGTLSVLPL